ncbi:alpha/beta hydrolase fold protein [Catenulispora acidiphila DSM 44928]|uniref:Alpha/beta hydrolase fold protein n=1 Tax=Catenulispora acidiphila (strain DSM 44928 / JCM 14897 / NBRC 102108 / NRRL B-24433 / ID139908) TaxID=479433 RepID=C7PXQ5_CATAD|nr:alpha/beta hydrolase [Catenulispora acidiphila]ACU71508.1 alpha/beta hydrolase fold protein [Catenulispora acidiphila DSM 44928]
MLNGQARTAVAELAAAVLSLRPMIDRLDAPVRVAVPGGARGAVRGLQTIVDRVCGRLGAPALELVRSPESDLDPFGAAAGRRLGLADSGAALAVLSSDDLPDVDRVVDEAVSADFDSFCEQRTVRGPDGVGVRAYAAGDPDAPAVVIASACGMPARLAEVWIRRLARDHRVLTWESRGLFCGCEDFAGATGVPAQADDLIAVMDAFELDQAHVMGLCGGAVIAITAAAAHPDRISSLSLWHGDFELGDQARKTEHQRNLQALMTMATRAKVSAAGVHAVLCRSIAASTPPELAHLVLYPYASPDLLFRYCLLNGAIMETDVRPELSAVVQPTLVVTSEDDTTAHPDGSRYVAAALPDARLHVVPHGDHISLFQGPPDLIDTASRFMAEKSDVNPSHR